jgi:hypothetical protein
MKRITIPISIALMLVGSSAAFAGPHCHVAMADWQPREALQAKVSALGWSLQRIKTDDGCYKVYALDSTGQRIKAKFDPATLEQLNTEHERH